VSRVTDSVLTRRGAATRQRLLDAAEQELVERDGGLEVASVAARADVSVGLLYRYFGSKAGLIAAVVDAFYDRLHAQVTDVDPAPSTDWATRERRRLELSVAFHYRDPLAAVILSRLSREPGVAAVEMRRIGRLVEDAARNVRSASGAARSARRRSADDGRDPLGGFRVAMAEALHRPERRARTELTDELWRFVGGGVGLAHWRRGSARAPRAQRVGPAPWTPPPSFLAGPGQPARGTSCRGALVVRGRAGGAEDRGPGHPRRSLVGESGLSCEAARARPARAGGRSAGA
jgi:AcrR family transcriptional regulator